VKTLADWQQALQAAQARQDAVAVDAALAAIVALQPQAAAPLLQWLQFRLAQGRIDDAAALLPELARRAPGGVDLAMASATIAEQRRQYETALAHYQQASALLPTLNAAAFGAARCLLALRRADAAVLPLAAGTAARRRRDRLRRLRTGACELRAGASSRRPPAVRAGLLVPVPRASDPCRRRSARGFPAALGRRHGAPGAHPARGAALQR
jgi:tetratricopeptide (TPR) repeat protein